MMWTRFRSAQLLSENQSDQSRTFVIENLLSIHWTSSLQCSNLWLCFEFPYLCHLELSLSAQFASMLELVWLFSKELRHFPVCRRRRFSARLKRREGASWSARKTVRSTLINDMNDGRFTQCVIQRNVDHAMEMACKCSGHPLERQRTDASTIHSSRDFVPQHYLLHKCQWMYSVHNFHLIRSEHFRFPFPWFQPITYRSVSTCFSFSIFLVLLRRKKSIDNRNLDRHDIPSIVDHLKERRRRRDNQSTRVHWPRSRAISFPIWKPS